MGCGDAGARGGARTLGAWWHVVWGSALILALALAPLAQARAGAAHGLRTQTLSALPSRRTPAVHRPGGPPAAPSLSHALLRGGRLRSGIHGAFDARGYRMILAPNGAPRFVRRAATATHPSIAAPSDPQDHFWSDAFGNVGAGDATEIYAVAVSGQNIYIGGYFSQISYDAGLSANNVAMYNGHGWYALGTPASNGVNGTVYALAVSGGKLYVGGQFDSAAGTPASAFAVWDGSSWSSPGGGMSSPTSGNTPYVYALAVSGSGTVYAGGNFDDAGPVVAHSIAAWDGTSWSPLGVGIQRCGYFDSANHCYSTPDDGTVNALAVSGSTLYAGGSFNLAGGAVHAALAAWSGSAWSSVGGNVINNSSPGTVYALAVTNSGLYVGGTFDHVGSSYDGQNASGGTAAASVAFWASGHWHTLGTGANNCSGCGSATVSSLAFWGGRLFMSGNFYGAGGDGKPYNAQWNGSAWSAIGPNLSGEANQLLGTSNGVIAAGGFSGTADSSVVLNNLGLWNGSSWTGYGLGLSYGTNAGSVSVLAASNHTLYAGGNYYTAGWTPAHNLAMFDGTRWQSMGGGISGNTATPYVILVSGSSVYVGGSFTQAGSVAATNVAMWDGSSWHALGSGVDGTVQALAMYNGKLWVGGSFAHAGGHAASDLAIWDPATSTWSPVGGELHYDGTVSALAPLPAPNNQYVVIGGSFQQVDTGGSSPAYTTVNSLVYFDTAATISGPASGYHVFLGQNGSAGVTDSYGNAGDVAALQVIGSKVYIGGSFDDGGTVASQGFVADDLAAAPDGWSSPGVVGGGSYGGGSVSAITQVGANLYLAGDFTSAGGAPASGVAKYTPSTGAWSGLGSGLNGTGSALAQSADGLYVGGSFGLAGGHPSENLGLWTATAFPLKVSATSSPNPDTADANTTVTATVNNTAPTAASGVILHATLPLNAIYVSAAPAQGTCSLSGRTLTCALGTVAAAAKTTVAIQLEPIQPGTVTTWFSASESGSTYTGLGRATVGVRGAAGSTYVSVADSGLAPSKLSFKAGTSVQFNFLGSSAHSVVDSIDGCDTGSQVGVSYAVCPYPAAGKFTAAEDGGTTHTASIAVANLVSPATVAHGNPVTVTGDTAAVPAGWGIDYQVQAPGGSWTTFARGASAGAVSYTPSLAGTYYFRSRLRNLTTGTASGFAPTTALAAS